MGWKWWNRGWNQRTRILAEHGLALPNMDMDIASLSPEIRWQLALPDQMALTQVQHVHHGALLYIQFKKKLFIYKPFIKVCLFVYFLGWRVEVGL